MYIVWNNKSYSTAQLDTIKPAQPNSMYRKPKRTQILVASSTSANENRSKVKTKQFFNMMRRGSFPTAIIGVLVCRVCLWICCPTDFLWPIRFSIWITETHSSFFFFSWEDKNQHCALQGNRCLCMAYLIQTIDWWLYLQDILHVLFRESSRSNDLLQILLPSIYIWRQDSFIAKYLHMKKCTGLSKSSRPI